MHAVYVFILLAGFAVSAQAQDFESNKQWCADDDADPDLQIGACTWLLNSDQLAEDLHAAAYYNRGYAYSKIGQYDPAIRDFDLAIALKPDYANAYSNRGYTYYLNGQLDRAIQDYDEAIRLKPDFRML